MGLRNLWRKGALAMHLKRAQWSSWVWWIELVVKAFKVKEVEEMLRGYKTYIVAALMAALTFAHSAGYIDDATYQTLLSLLASGGFATVAAKINRINPPGK